MSSPASPSLDVVICYFSGTGNTWWAATRLTELLRARGCTVSLVSLESPVGRDPARWRPLVSRCDVLGVLFPCYGSTYPRIFDAWLADLPPGGGKRAFCATTMALFSGDTALHFGRRLKKRGYRVRQGINVRMFTNIYLMGLRLPADPAKWERRLTKARAKLERLAAAVVTGKKWRQRRDPVSLFVAWLQRVGFNKEFEWMLKKWIIMDPARCTGCGRCVEACPVDALALEARPVGDPPAAKKVAVRVLDPPAEEGGDPQPRCIACARCYNLCPAHAIYFTKKTRDADAYPRYDGPVPEFALEKLQRSDMAPEHEAV